MQFLCSTEPERRTAAHCSLDLLQRSEGHPEVTRRPRVQAVLQWAAACSVTQHVDCRHMMQLLQTVRTLSWAPRCRAAVLQCRMLIVVCGQSNVLTTLHILHTFFVTSETSILMVSNNMVIADQWLMKNENWTKIPELDVVFSPAITPTSAVGDSGKQEDAFVEDNNFSNLPPQWLNIST